MKSRPVALASALLLLCVWTPANAANKKASAAATMKLVSTTVTPNVGIIWDTGKLHYKSHYYDMKVEGITVTTLGISSVTVIGRVFHVSNVEDIEGHYVAAAAGSQIGGGAQGFAMKNEKGVEIYLNSWSRGISVAMAPAGVQISLIQSP